MKWLSYAELVRLQAVVAKRRSDLWGDLTIDKIERALAELIKQRESEATAEVGDVD